MKRILVYGFEPYGGLKENISEQVVKRLPKQPGLIKKIMPVQFSKISFIKLARKNNVDFILGLGQHPTAKKIRIERKAVNLFGKKGGHLLKIQSGPRYLFVPSKLPATRKNCRVSYDAGRYVCNYSMCILVDACQRRGIGYAFMHIPRGLSVSEASVFVKGILERIRSEDF